MDEIIDELRERNVSVLSPLELPTEDDILEVEAQLYLSVGKDFHIYLLMASDVIYGTLEPVTAADPNSHTYLPEVAAIAWDKGLPRELIPLCEVSGDYYAVDEKGQVLFWQGRDEIEESWDCIGQWIQEVWLNS